MRHKRHCWFSIQPVKSSFAYSFDHVCECFHRQLVTNPSQHSCLKNSHGDAHEWVASLDRTYDVFVLVIEVSCARPWIQSWPTIRFCNVPVSLRDTKIYEEKRSGNKIRSLGIPVGETLSRSLRPFVPFLTFVSNKHDFELYLSNYILREAKSMNSLSFRSFVFE